MSIFFPHERYKAIQLLSPKALVERGIKGVVLDIDNTLTTHDNPIPAEGVLDWIKEAKELGLKLLVLSNNSAQRVEPFAKALGLEFEANGKKPLTGGYKRALAKMQLPKNQVATIGDQIFTDILGGRLAGVHCVFVDPIKEETTTFFKFKRRLEKPILNKYERRRLK